VTLEGAVDSQGKVTILRVVKGLGYGLDQRAIGAALSWKFVPAIQNGIPVQAVAQIDVDFKLPPETPYRIGGGITAPLVISRVEPQYTDEARNLRYTGTVVLNATVGVDGTIKVAKAIRELDHGLTESAIAALEQWKFKPGVKDGKPVPISLNIEVNFNLK
jgi:TonB family protein